LRRSTDEARGLGAAPDMITALLNLQSKNSERPQQWRQPRRGERWKRRPI